MKFLIAAMTLLTILTSASYGGDISADIAPHFENEKVIGFKFEKIAAGSEWEKDGLKNGDVVLSINGASIEKFGTSPIEFVSALNKPTRAELVVLRNGKKKKVSFQNRK